MKRAHQKMKHLNRFHFTPHLILIIFLLIFTFSCSNEDKQPKVVNEISEEIKNLIYFKGDENASTVLINVQSGPDTKLSTLEVDDFFETFNIKDILVANVHQAQTLNPSILEKSDITLNQAINFNTESIETLYKVIQYFKNQGRTVYVVGISFGAFITQELIAKKGIDVADKYLIMIGRLDINDIMWQGLSEGKNGFFENGITPIINSNLASDIIERNLNRITAGLGMNRYTELFNAIESLSNVTYIYGATDNAVGSLTSEEITFLESKNTNIIAGNGGHDETYEDFILQGLNEAFGIK